MKTTRALLALFSAMTAASIASAQTIQFLFVTKLVDYDQTGASTTAIIANPYVFGASIDGTSLNSGYPVSPTVTVQNGTAGSVGLAFDFDSWGYESTGYADQASLNAAFGSGNYTFSSSSFSSVIFNLSNADLYPNAPQASIITNSGLGIEWSGGVLLVNPSLFTTLTVTTNAFATNFSVSANHIGISGDNFTTNVSAEAFNDADGVLSLNISSATFLSGSSDKSLELEFNNIIDNFANTPMSGATAISAFSSATKITIQVIPEPSTYVAILGTLALAGVMIHRRRRVV